MVIRDFKLPNGETVADPDPDQSPDAVRQMLAYMHPELTNAAINETEAGGRQTIEFVVQVGKKG